MHVNEVDGQGTLAGGIKALRRVTLAQADELVPLPDLLPGMLIVEETLGELAHRRPQQRRA